MRGLGVGVMIGAVAAGWLVVAGGCQLIAGVKDAVPYPPDGGTGSGGATTCAPGTTIACAYSGPMGTQDVGICRAGEQLCKADGTGDGVCSGEVTPKAESCAATEDENCDGYDCVQWAQLFGDGADQRATGIAVDAKGNIFVVGTFAGAITLNGMSISSAGSTDIFLLKLDPNGRMLWGKAFGDVNAQEGQSIAVNSVGDVVFAGTSISGVSIGGSTLDPGLFVAKLSSEGQYLWSNGLRSVGCGGTLDSTVASIVATSTNDFIIVGGYCGSIDFGDGAIASQMTSEDGFVAMLRGGSGSGKKADGAWARIFGDKFSQRATSAALLPGSFGTIAVAGTFEGTMTLSSGYSLTSTGNTNIFVAKMSQDGTIFDLNGYGDTENQNQVSVAASPDGSLVLGGQFRGNITFDTKNVSSPAGANSIYIAKFDSSGTCQWAKAVAKGQDFFGGLTNIASDSKGNIVFTGIFSGGSIDIDNNAINSTGTNLNMFVAKITNTGQPAWIKQYDEGVGYGIASVHLTPTDEPVLAGVISAPIDLGTGVLTPVGGFDGLVVKLSP